MQQRPCQATTSGEPSRRVVITGIGAVGLSVGIAACGGGGAKSSDLAKASGSSVAAADVPVGGAVYLPDVSAIVTQPKKGEFKAFSSVCTHQGCAVSKLQDGKLLCPCHGSEFTLDNGGVAHGPATSSLPAKKVARTGDKLQVS